MLEIICMGVLSFSINTCQRTELIDLTGKEEAKVSRITSVRGYLAKGKPHESEYRREADREKPEIRDSDRDRDRNYRDVDRRREDVEDDRDNQDRIYLDPDYSEREEDYEDGRERSRRSEDDTRDRRFEDYIEEYIRRNR